MKKSTVRRRQSQGFSLMEMLIVIVIIGILTSLVVMNFSGATDQANQLKVEQAIRTLSNNIELYRGSNGRYPSSDAGLQALVNKTEDVKNWPEGGYLKKIPADPWGNDYRYVSPGNNGAFDVYSLGPDGRESGDDIGNWMLE